jgi:putative colanic acid biosynthesis UDP-glucose lipid carrier transferase
MGRAETVNTIPLRPAATIKIGRENILSIIEMLLDPLILVSTLWGIDFWIEGGVSPPDLLLAIIVFSLTFPGNSYINQSHWYLVSRVFAGWLFIVALLVLFGFASRYIQVFDPDVLLTWLWLAPASLVCAHLALRQTAPAIIKLQGEERRAIVVGMNEQGLEVARTIRSNPFLAVRLLGFFDDRILQRLNSHDQFAILGRLADMASFVKQNQVNVIYLSLPMVSQPRILDLLDQLRDTTASIYFVPDTFVTDLIQGRADVVGNIPVLAVCETPFRGSNGLIKRLSDIVLAMLILILILPLLLLIAMLIKLTSPGPVIFKQRRYGLDGKEIIVYKFRSMTVCENGPQIAQARINDPRITPLGAFLRKTSLDELPQFFNVLQNRMSIVGPRPHAIAHNEQYRKLIKGYMLRHKVKPGITGWAQVNGHRGETDTLDKMKQRIEYDLDYLRHWSLKLDISIILRTILIVFSDRNAY